jgi:hypothetical protein
LAALSKKNVKFDWSDACEQTFQCLKTAFITASVLIHFDPDKKLYLEINASDYVIDGTISQIGDNNFLHSVAFFSKKHSTVKCNYNIYDKELLTIIRALKK